MLRLHPDWKKIALKAWSQRFNYLLALMAGGDAAISYIVDGRVGASLAVFGMSVATSVARLVKQKDVSGDDE